MNGSANEIDDLLALLGADVVAAVRPHLTGEASAALDKSGDKGALISPKKRERLLSEFNRFLNFVMTQTPPPKSPRAELVEEEPAVDEWGREPEQILAAAPAERFSWGVQGEQPRVVAAVLDSLPPLRCAELLKTLPEAIRPEVVKELSRGMKILPAVRACLLRSVAERIKETPGETPRNDDHIVKLAEIIRACEKSSRKPLIAALKEQDEDTATRLLDLLYRFDDLTTLDDRSVQQILGQIDVSTLAAAMAGAESTITEKILKNLSRRASEMLREELQFAGRVPSSKVEQARAAISKLIAKTEQEAE
jgi:flagellar motor switch protein FliG